MLPKAPLRCHSPSGYEPPAPPAPIYSRVHHRPLAAEDGENKPPPPNAHAHTQAHMCFRGLRAQGGTRQHPSWGTWVAQSLSICFQLGS